MSNYATYRWEFRDGSVRERSYLEGRLEQVGRPGEHAYLLTVELVRDEMALPTDGFPLLDPERRTGVRIYVTTLRSREDGAVRQLAYVAPIEGGRMAYTLMFKALQEHQDAVKKFGDKWLIETVAEFAEAQTPKNPWGLRAATEEELADGMAIIDPDGEEIPLVVVTLDGEGQTGAISETYARRLFGDVLPEEVAP